jgi:hypothetical protein
MKITLNLSTLYQALVWLAGICGLAVAHGLVPDRYRMYVVIPGAVLAGVTSLKLHREAGSRNPDGTPAVLPYAPDAPAIASAMQAAGVAYRAYEALQAPANGEKAKSA